MIVHSITQVLPHLTHQQFIYRLDPLLLLFTSVATLSLSVQRNYYFRESSQFKTLGMMQYVFQPKQPKYK